MKLKNYKNNNDSEFYLDDDFYDRMAKEFAESQKPKRVIDLDQIRFNDDEYQKNLTVDEDQQNDEEEDEDGYNHLLVTSDGKNRNGEISRQIMQLAENRRNEENNANNEIDENNNIYNGNDNHSNLDNEESKEPEQIMNKMDSLSNEDLEIRIDSIAPKSRGWISQKKLDEGEKNEKEDDEDEKNEKEDDELEELL